MKIPQTRRAPQVIVGLHEKLEVEKKVHHVGDGHLLRASKGFIPRYGREFFEFYKVGVCDRQYQDNTGKQWYVGEPFIYTLATVIDDSGRNLYQEQILASKLVKQGDVLVVGEWQATLKKGFNWVVNVSEVKSIWEDADVT